jgi:hypothetical protein
MEDSENPRPENSAYFKEFNTEIFDFDKTSVVSNEI